MSHIRAKEKITLARKIKPRQRIYHTLKDVPFWEEKNNVEKNKTKATLILYIRKCPICGQKKNNGDENNTTATLKLLLIGFFEEYLICSINKMHSNWKVYIIH